MEENQSVGGKLKAGRKTLRMKESFEIGGNSVIDEEINFNAVKLFRFGRLRAYFKEVKTLKRV